MQKGLQNTTRKISGDLIEVKNGFPDTISSWIEAYFRFEVTTSKASQKTQKRDLYLFRDFMMADSGREDRALVDPEAVKGLCSSI